MSYMSYTPTEDFTNGLCNLNYKKMEVLGVLNI